MTGKPKSSPIPPSERIVSIDVLRGFALLGILVMNIQSFSMISAAYHNPTAYGDLTGINRLVWLLCHIFADQKFMTLFSVLFGAGIVLMADRAASKGVRPAGVHYRRTFWLILFGILHAHLLWFGDVLYFYGMCGLLVYLFRRLPPIWLFILGLLSLCVCSALYLFFGWSIPYWPEEAVTGSIDQMWAPPAERVAAEVSAYTGSYGDQMTERVPTALIMEVQAFLFWASWRAGGLMLIGMALFKWRVLSAALSNRFYIIMTAAGFGIGIPIVAYGAHLNFDHGWTYEYSFFIGSQFNYWGSLFVAAGYLGAVMLAVRSAGMARRLTFLSAVGRTAFSNYLLQSVICTTLFYGHGFGLFGSVERWGQILIVPAVWVVQVLLSVLWVKRYRLGPAEWVWRTLTYWKMPEMRMNRM